MLEEMIEKLVKQSILPTWKSTNLILINYTDFDNKGHFYGSITICYPYLTSVLHSIFSNSLPTDFNTKFTIGSRPTTKGSKPVAVIVYTYDFYSIIVGASNIKGKKLTTHLNHMR